MKNLLFGAGLVALGLFSTVSIHNQNVLIDKQDAHITTLETKLSQREQLVSEQKQTLQKTSGELKTTLQKVNTLEKDLKKSNDKLQKKESEVNSLTKKLRKLEERKSEPNHVHRTGSSLQLVATAYTPYCAGCSGTTSTGENVTDNPFIGGRRVVATDPSIIPTGTKLTVHTKSGSFQAIASDKGGAIKGRKMDVLFMTEHEAINFGRQTVTVSM